MFSIDYLHDLTESVIITLTGYRIVMMAYMHMLRIIKTQVKIKYENFIVFYIKLTTHSDLNFHTDDLRFLCITKMFFEI